LKRKLRNIIAAQLGLLLILSGTIRRAKKKIQKNNYVTAVYFHNPSKSLFEKCISWLKKNSFNLITCAELIAVLRKEKEAPKNAVWISLDDGWKDNMTNVLPYAIENKIPLTFFISTGPVEGSGVFWWRAAEGLNHLLPEPFKTDINKLWEVPEKIRTEVIKNLMENGGDKCEREAMIINDVKKIAEYEFMTIGSHTVNHVITPNCTDDELNFELSESKRKLEEWTGKKTDTFCYPNGDHSGKEEEFLTQNGYVMAVAADNKFITNDTDLYKVTRFSVGEGYFPEELCHMLGVWQKAVKKIKVK